MAKAIPMLLRGAIEECTPRVFPAANGRPERTVYELNVFIKKEGYFKVTAQTPVEVDEDKIVDISVGVANDSYASATQPRLTYIAHVPAVSRLASQTVVNQINAPSNGAGKVSA